MTAAGVPIDEIHAACLNARQRIRDRARFIAAQIAVWEPRPAPPRRPR